MRQFKKLFLSISLIFSVCISTYATSLNISDKPIKLTVYLDEALPFSGFNAKPLAQGMLVDYWQEWSKVTAINVEFKPYHGQNLTRLLTHDNMAIYSGLNTPVNTQNSLKSQAIMRLSSEFYYLSENHLFIQNALNDQRTPVVVGGLLPEAKLLPFISHHSNITYQESTGILALLTSLYRGEIDSILLFKVVDTPATLIEKLLPYLLSLSEVSADRNALYAYSVADNESLLTWIKWGIEKEQLVAKLAPLLESVTVSQWGVSKVTGRYLLIVLLFLLLIILLKQSKKQKAQHLNYLLGESLYPLIICGLNGKELYFTNTQAKSLFSFKKNKQVYLFEESKNQLKLSQFIKKMTHQSIVKDTCLNLHGVSRFYDIEVSAKRIHYQGESAWLCYFNDITEQVKLQNDLHKEREKFNKVLASISEQVSFISPQGDIVGCNDSWVKANNTTVLDATGTKEATYFNESQAKISAQQNIDVLAGEAFYAQEWIAQKNKAKKLINQSKLPLYDQQGKVFSILSVVTDMTATHLLSEQLKGESTQRQQAEKSLSQQTVLLESIFANAKGPVGVLDEKGLILAASRAFSAFMGSDLEDLSGLLQQNILPYERADWHDRQNKEIMKSGESITFEEFVFFNNEEIWYEVNKTPFNDPTGDFRGIAISAKNITDSKNQQLKLEQAESKLQRQSLHDPLTGVANRRVFDEIIEEYWNKAVEKKAPLTLLIGDLDCFKSYNEAYGKSEGNEVLQVIGHILQRKCVEHDCFVARYGGDEFVVLIKDKNVTHALRIAEDIRSAIESEGIEHSKSLASLFVTMSIGMATQIASDRSNSKLLIKEADKALFKAKSTGRNQVQVT
ncbi:diguanylate cyclase [Psychromonas sp. RZ22]|uniref:transporter substrate-binding domain-containing diguanylate cyclase n=1 Tax=Psychromonas algarum TaxID=2555643 RepID=UPI0010682845|nr:diguanylate cyclase [Psychromonas sp. RZ22]TEW55005.1 diguanylate cyclase [Psychromonas sp. RZ22]